MKLPIVVAGRVTEMQNGVWANLTNWELHQQPQPNGTICTNQPQVMTTNPVLQIAQQSLTGTTELTS